MIINNYNGSLHENTETNMTATKCPMINIRAFEASIKAGGHLVIPYYVSDFDQVEYRQEKLGPTFTTAFALDEDTVPANQVRTWKQTTYAGEQVIDLGVFNEVGIHTLNVRTIQSNGVASATKPLKFIVHPAGTKTVLDLSTLSGFAGVFSGYRRYNNIWRHGNIRVIGPIKEEYNCRYVVSKTVETVDGTQVTTDIKIVVIKPNSGYCLVHHNIDDYGSRTNVDGRYDFTGAALADGERIDGGYDSSAETVVGVFHVATRCVVNGSTVELKDYLGVPLSRLPAAVIETAAKNKVALTRLFEAAKAWRFQQVYEDLVNELDQPTEEGLAACAVAASDAVKYEFEFKMPQMDIVCDYHYANGSGYYDYLGTLTAEQLNAGISNEGDIDGTSEQTMIASHTRKYFHGRDDIMLPDGITIDMNDTTISMLQITNVKGGRLLHILNNINTHIINGNFVGNYKNVEFAHAHDMETLHMLSIHASLFCSFDSLDVSWSVGYEMHIGNDEGQQIGIDDSVIIPITDCVSFDQNGIPSPTTTDEGGYGWHCTYGGNSCKVLNYGWTVCGREIRIIRYNESMALDNGYGRFTKTCREMYVHFYDMSNNFVKTVKVLERWPVLIPYGAWRMRISIYGTNNSGSSYKGDYLYSSNTNFRYGRNFCNLSWGSGASNIRLHDTRTCTFDNGGVQTYINGAKFRNVAGERNHVSTHYEGDCYNFSKMLLDQEDDAFNLYNWTMNGLEQIFGDTRAIRVSRGYDGHIKNCRNIHIDTGVDIMDLLVENSSFSIGVKHEEDGIGSGAHYIIRNCLISAFVNNNSGSAYEQGGKLWVRNNCLFTAQPTNGIGEPVETVEEFDTIKL